MAFVDGCVTRIHESDVSSIFHLIDDQFAYFSLREVLIGADPALCVWSHRQELDESTSHFIFRYSGKPGYACF